MALSILRSCIKSRLTIGVSRKRIVLESKVKVTCPERHAPGTEFVMTVASTIRKFSSFTRGTRTRSKPLTRLSLKHSSLDLA
ncbi:hypothetical protein F2Q70_00015493 [Brassica cretica]|uniref:Uncharacterized protein n=1 Tax=Brassica cretica TaxID=69181 RepID=A0A8S9HZ49_BRACR|nr:hypothetical protein F2Q70_00015493 [Brassica cretica]KAF3535428.1 hypothetical protein F2Q69_00020087 [Brassica cretica]